MSLGVTVDFNANIARFTTQIDRLSGDLSRFQQHAETMSSRVNRAFSTLGVGLSVAGLTAFVKSGIDAADAFNDMSLKTGIAVENLAGFELATKQSGTNMEAFVASANKLNISMGKNSEAFAQLGIDAKDPAEAFIQLADVMSNIEDPQQRAALGAKALGKNWAEMAPLLLQGGAALRASVEEGAKLSGVTKKMAEEADKFNDQIETMRARLSSVAAIAGGAFAEGFNQLIEKIGQATQSGITFNNVMTGIGDFAFQNMFDDVERIATLSTEVNALNDKIVKAKEGLKNAKGDPNVPRDILHKAGDNSAEIAAEQKLNDLLFERDKLIIHLGESRKKAESPQTAAPTQKTIADFIGGSGDGEANAGSSKKPRSVSKSASFAARPKEIEDVTAKYDDMIKQMERENALHGETTDIVKLQYDIQHGAFSQATRDQQIRLQQLAYEKDSLDQQERQWAALVESANEYYDLRKSNSDLIKSGDVQSGFNQALANTQDKLTAGDINTTQAAEEFTKLGKAYNDEFIGPAKDATNELSEYAIQGARNMQSAFADFLFDPFNEGMDSLLDGFLTTIRKMAANAASAQIMETLFGATGKSDGGGLAGTAVTAIMAALLHEGGSVGSGGSPIAVSPLAFAGAPRFHTGALVGKGGGTASVSPAIFAAAPRYHSGGIAGLKHDEIPAILQKGELVISKQQIADSKGGTDLTGISALIASVFHTGGVVGKGGGTASVSPAVFTSAPRYHSGGVAGIRPSATQNNDMTIAQSQSANIQSNTGDISISTQVNVTGGNNSDDKNMLSLGNIINARIKQVITTEKRPGGLLA